MRAHRRSIRLLPAFTLLAALLAPGLAGSALATTTVLEGSITADDGVTWSEDAVAVVTLVDMSAKPEAGAILGQQRIDDPGAGPIRLRGPVRRRARRSEGRLWRLRDHRGWRFGLRDTTPGARR